MSRKRPHARTVEASPEPRLSTDSSVLPKRGAAPARRAEVFASGRSGGTRWKPGARAGIVAVAILLGLATSRLDLIPLLVGVATLLPLASHVRWVGLRRAITEPSVVTIIVFFYLSVFPQRGLAITLNDFADVRFALTAADADLAWALLLASLGTTALVEAFHFVETRGGTRAFEEPARRSGTRFGVVPLAILLGALTLLALVALLLENGGLAGAQSAFLSHSKSDALEARSFALSLWSTAAVPAVWCATYAALAARKRTVRVSFMIVAVVIVLAMVIVFGSRLDALLALAGAWVVLHYNRRTVPVWAVLASAALIVLISVPIVSQRDGGQVTGLSAYEKYSRIASYGVLDASLAVQESPGDLRRKLTDRDRWLALPLYLVPSSLWPGKPSIDTVRMDVLVAQSIGTTNQQDTGFPTSYVTELWLYGGWPAVLLASIGLGALLGALHRTLVGPHSTRAKPAALLWYCVVVLAGFSYYKDGDLLMTAVGSGRTAIYLGGAMLITGAWTPFADRGAERRQLARAAV